MMDVLSGHLNTEHKLQSTLELRAFCGGLAREQVHVHSIPWSTVMFIVYLMKHYVKR